MRRRRRIITLCCLTSMIALVLFWLGLDGPSLRLILRYGPPPAGGPTGRVETVAGLDFVEVEPGDCRVTRRILEPGGDTFGRALGKIGLPVGETDVIVPEYHWDRHVEVPRRFWISRRTLRPEEMRALAGFPHPDAINVTGPMWTHESFPGSLRCALAEETWLALATDAVTVGSEEPEYAELALVWHDHPRLVPPWLEPYYAVRTIPVGTAWRRHVDYDWLSLDKNETYELRLAWIPPGHATDAPADSTIPMFPHHSR